MRGDPTAFDDVGGFFLRVGYNKMKTIACKWKEEEEENKNKTKKEKGKRKRKNNQCQRENECGQDKNNADQIRSDQCHEEEEEEYSSCTHREGKW